MATQARSRELFSKFLFTVHDMSSGFQTSKFQKCTGLKKTIAHAEYAEGGAFTPMKEPGRVTYANITLTRGVSEDDDFYTWCEESCSMMANFPEGSGVPVLELLRNLQIWQRDRTQAVRKKFKCYSCSPAVWDPSEWDNMSDDVQVESLEIALWYFQKAAA